MERRPVLVIGMGEVGRPLAALLSDSYAVETLDVDSKEIGARPHVVHVCYPYEIPDFVDTTVEYLARFKPDLAVINSTVGIGSTRRIWRLTGIPVVHSPVRGKHDKMLEELRAYTKYIGPIEPEHGEEAARHFQAVGVRTRMLNSPEASELAKLSETTYFGLLIAWAQEVERYCLRLGLDYDEIVSFYEEIGFFPAVRYFPGVIGGHCVMPNVQILKKTFGSRLLEAIERSNERKIELEAKKQVARAQPT